MSRPSVKSATAALIAHHGILSKAAEALGCTRMTLYRLLEKHPELEEVREEAGSILLDIAESNVVTDIKAGEMKTTRWYLDRKGKDRGYVTRVEETGKDGTPLHFGKVERVIVDPAEDGNQNDNE